VHSAESRWYTNSAFVAIMVALLTAITATVPAGIGMVVSGIGIVIALQMASAVLPCSV
jgi:hypothetical protein